MRRNPTRGKATVFRRLFGVPTAQGPVTTPEISANGLESSRLSVPILEPGLLWSIAMANGQRQPLGRLKSGLIAATFGLTLVAVAVLPAVAQELEQPDTTATVQGIAVEPAAGNASAAQSLADHHDGGIDWRPVLSESLLFLTAQHLARFHEDRRPTVLAGRS